MDLPDLKLEADKLSVSRQALGEVEGDSEAQDSTHDQENRGFVQILDFLARKKRKQEASPARTAQMKAISRYGALDRTEADLVERGQIVNRKV